MNYCKNYCKRLVINHDSSTDSYFIDSIYYLKKKLCCPKYSINYRNWPFCIKYANNNFKFIIFSRIKEKIINLYVSPDCKQKM